MENFRGRHSVFSGLGIWLAVACIFMTLPGRVEAEDSAASYAVELISLIRQDPLSYAEALGYNRDNLLASLPWLVSELSQGMPGLVSSDFLTQSAAANNAGSVIGAEAGYSTSFARTGTISGAVSFSNFMEAATAVQIVVNNQFVQELSPAFGGQRCVLSKDLDLAGAAVDGTSINGVNAYMATICLGSSMLKTDRQILNQINQLRADPVGTGAALNLDLSGYAGVYPPLFINDLLENFTGTPYAADPYYKIHLQNYGYAGYRVGKITTLADLPKADLDTVAFWLFSSLLVNEVKGLGDGSTILGPYLNEIGLGLVYMSGDTWDHASLTAIAGLNIDLTPDRKKIYGVVFNDVDQSGIYTPGEDRSGRIVQIFRADTQALAAVVLTDHTGYFEVELDSGLVYTVLTSDGEVFAANSVALNDHQFVSLKVTD